MPTIGCSQTCLRVASRALAEVKDLYETWKERYPYKT